MTIKYTLYYYSFCPFSRKIMFLLNYLGKSANLVEKQPWELTTNDEIFALNPTLELPILYDNENKIPIVDSYVIADFLVDKSFYGQNEFEAKRLIMFFEKSFYQSVSKFFIKERIFNFYRKEKINATKLKAAQDNLDIYMSYIENILSTKMYVSSDDFTLADITIACHFSILDYFGEINWKKYQKTKLWYQTIKSKPQFSNLLEIKLNGITPSKHYQLADF
ncbi:MAG: glutathione S-transferase family protein [Rickettsiales bacterium]|nr:MAG: glutathione S-transferase family protein [Rickettsiales bacterium]